MSRKHIFTVDDDGQAAVCSCGAERIKVELPPPWADEVADIVDPEDWRGRIDDHDLEISYTAEGSDRDGYGAYEWTVDDCEVRLGVGNLDLRSDYDGDGYKGRVMRALVAAVNAFNDSQREAS